MLSYECGVGAADQQRAMKLLCTPGCTDALNTLMCKEAGITEAGLELDDVHSHHSHTQGLRYHSSTHHHVYIVYRYTKTPMVFDTITLSPHHHPAVTYAAPPPRRPAA